MSMGRFADAIRPPSGGRTYGPLTGSDLGQRPIPDQVRLNVAMMICSWVTVATQAVAETGRHGPVHPTKLEPVLGLATSRTFAPSSYDSLQSEPQAMPPGWLRTTPFPVPARCTLRVNVGV